MNLYKPVSISNNTEKIAHCQADRSKIYKIIYFHQYFYRKYTNYESLDIFVDLSYQLDVTQLIQKIPSNRFQGL